MQFKNLKSRVLTALILSAVIVASGLFAAYSCSGKWFLISLLLLGNMLCAAEFSLFCSGTHKEFAGRGIYFLTALFPSLICFLSVFSSEACSDGVFPQGVLPLALCGTFFALLVAVAAASILGRSALFQSSMVFQELNIGVLLIGLGGACWLLLPLLFGDVRHFFWVILVVCINDISAYFVGQRVGGPKLAPEISPSKTVSGSIGGFCGGVIVGLLAAKIFGFEISLMQLLLNSLVVVFAAQCGDLLKSLLKRINTVKDSSSLLPGHGGVLDRLDGLLFAAPAYCILFLNSSL